MLSFILVTAIVCLNLSINTENIYASHLDPSESKIKNITIENGTLTITVSTEKELQDLIDDLDKQTKNAEAKYKAACLSGKSQNPDYSSDSAESFNTLNGCSPLSTVSGMLVSDDTYQRVRYNGFNAYLHCYINYKTTTNTAGAKVFSSVISKHLYCEDANTINNKSFSNAKYLDSRRTYAFTYSCTVVIKLHEDSVERKASQYCEFYSNGTCYPTK